MCKCTDFVNEMPKWMSQTILAHVILHCKKKKDNYVNAIYQNHLWLSLESVTDCDYFLQYFYKLNCKQSPKFGMNLRTSFRSSSHKLAWQIIPWFSWTQKHLHVDFNIRTPMFSKKGLWENPSRFLHKLHWTVNLRAW